MRNLNMTIALGLSAIDMLCCALVAALVLFFVLTSQGNDEESIGSPRGQSSGIHVTLVYDVPAAIATLRFLDPNMADDPIDFWSDQTHLGPSENAKTHKDFLQPSGFLFERTDPLEKTIELVATNLRPANWQISLTYSDTVSGLAASAPPKLIGNVTIVGVCSAVFTCPVDLGTEVKLEACRQENKGGDCSLNQLLRAASLPRGK